MNRAESLDKAKEMVDAMADVPTKPNGYPIDGAKRPTLEEQTRAILLIAEFLWEPGPDRGAQTAP